MTDTLKILCVHQGYELYGSDKVFLQTIAALKKKWPTAEITARLPQDGPLVEHLEQVADNVEIGDLWVLRRANLKWENISRVPSVFVNMFKAWQEARRYDFVYINTLMPLSHLLVNRLHRVPSLTHVHEIACGLNGFILNAICFLAGGDFLANSKATACSIKPVFGFRKHIVLNGVEAPKGAIKPITAKKTLNLLHVGRLNDTKGQDVLIRAIARLPKDYQARVKVRIIGDVFGGQDFYSEELEGLIKEQGVERQVEMLPFTDDLASHYNWADCVVLSSKKPESFGLTVVESMAHGRAVIVSNIGALPELVEDGKNGFIVKPNDFWSLNNTIVHYLDYSDELKKHGEHGLKLFKKKFTARRYEKEIVETIEPFVDGTRVSTIRQIYTDLLKKTGKNYEPDPAVSDTVLVGSLISRAVWLVRGFIRLQKKVFIASRVQLRGKNGIQIGEYSTLERRVKIDGVAKNGVRIGKGVRLGAYTEISCTSHFSKLGQGVEIGDGTGIGPYSFIGASGGVKIGSNVITGQYVTFHAQDHVFDDKSTPIKDQGVTEQGIEIGDDCWIGAKVTFLDGAKVGNHCVVAAGAVVKGEFPDHSVIGGVPAKVIKKR